MFGCNCEGEQGGYTMKYLGNICYSLYNWNARVKWWFDFEWRIFFVNPRYEEEFIEKVKQDT